MSQPKKVALITGANKGIGLEIARQLGEQGIVVLIGARNRARGEEAAGRLAADGIEAQVLQLDVTDQQSIEKAAHWLSESYGKLDILVNNAAIASIQSAQSRFSSEVLLEDVRALYETNVFGLFAVTEAMLPLLRRPDTGRIVNLSSGLASLGNISRATPELLQGFKWPYASTKTAVNAMTIFLAKELEQTGIKVNAVDPGRTATDMARASGQTGSKVNSVDPGRTATGMAMLPAAHTPQQAAQVAVRLATIPADGPTGGFFDKNGPLPW